MAERNFTCNQFSPHLCLSTFDHKFIYANSCLHDEGNTSEISTPDGTMCKNGGTPIDSYTCMCPGGLVGKTCELNNLCHLYNHICIIKYKIKI